VALAVVKKDDHDCEGGRRVRGGQTEELLQKKEDGSVKIVLHP
jgi:hypothetical protein